MKLTNEHGINEVLYKAMLDQQWRYKATHGEESFISVTQLINSPQIVHLQKEYGDQLVEDASQNVYSLLGSLMHQALENIGGHMDGWTVEKRLYFDVELPEMGVFKLSGMFDAYDWDTKTLSDYKLCSVWEHVHGPKVDWVHQLNVLAFMAHHSGYEVEKLTVEAVYRDWSKGKSNGDNYPSSQTESIEIPLWPYEKQKEYVEDRMELHVLTQNGHPYECTDEERWAKPDIWAVMKEGRKSAVKLHEIEEDAYRHAENLSFPKHYVQHRPGENTRCENYCNVKEFCPQYSGYVEYDY